MRYIPTIILTLLTILLGVAATFLVIDGNLARLTGWYHFQKGGKLFEGQTSEVIEKIDWIRIDDLHSSIKCEKRADGSWWIISPYQDRMSPLAAEAILKFTEQTRIVDTLPLNTTVKRSLREFGVETRPFTLTLKSHKNSNRTTIARYTLGSQAPWYADALDGKQVLPTCYARSDYYGRDKRIHVISGSILPLFKNGLRDLRDMRVFQVNPDVITGIEIFSTDENKQSISMQRISAESNWNIKSPITTSADQDKVNNFIDKLCNLTAIRVNDLSDVEIPDSGETTVITIKDIQGNNLSLTLYPEVYNKDLDASVQLACVSDRDVVFTLQSAPRIRRKGEYATIVNAVYKLPILPEEMLAKLRTGKTPVYTQEFNLSLSSLRSKQFTQIKSEEISRLALRSKFSTNGLRLVLIPGDKTSEVKDMWMYSIGYENFTAAETSVVNNLISSLSSVPVDDFLYDVDAGSDLNSALTHYGLNDPDYTLTLLLRPCALRSFVFGIDMPLIKDRAPISFIFKRYNDEQSQESYWVGNQVGSGTIYRISPKLTRNFSLLKNQWKERQIIRFSKSSLREITMGFQHAPLKLQYDYIGESWTGTLEGKDVTPHINPYRAQHYLSTLQKLRAHQWLDKNDFEALKALQTPAYTIQLSLEINKVIDQEAVIINQDTDTKEVTASVNAEAFLNEGDADDDQRLRDLALTDYDTVTKQITIEIAPMQAREDTMFYGRVIETGELFILSQQDALSLATGILEGL